MKTQGKMSWPPAFPQEKGGMMFPQGNLGTAGRPDCRFQLYVYAYAPKKSHAVSALVFFDSNQARGKETWSFDNEKYTKSTEKTLLLLFTSNFDAFNLEIYYAY